MIDPHISDQEKICVRFLAKLFNEGTNELAEPRKTLEAEGLVSDYRSYVVLMRMMERYGAIQGAMHTAEEEGDYFHFFVSPGRESRGISWGK